MQSMAMPAAHRMSQSGQWQQLQSQWEQQQQQRHHLEQQQQQHMHPQHDAYFQQQQPYNDYYDGHHQPQHPSAYPPYPTPPMPPLLLRIAVSPTQTQDLPISVTADTDVGAIAQHFCRTHGIAGESKLQKLQAMIERSVEQHRQQYAQQAQPAPYCPPYPADSQYEHPDGGEYYGEAQRYAEAYGGQYGMQQEQAKSADMSPHPSQLSGAESEEMSPLQPTFTPSRPTSAMSHSHHDSHPPPQQQHFSHSQPTPSLRPSSLHLPASSSASPRSSSPRPVSPHTAGYLNAPASARLYANAAVKQRQLARHQQQKKQLDAERQQEELQQCTFTPHLSKHSSQQQQQQSERRQGRRQYEWIEDWNGEKRERRLQRMREAERKRLTTEECSFTPAVNAVSQQLVQLSKANPPKAQKPKATAAAEEVQRTKQLDAAAKEKIAQFLQRTIERQAARKQALVRLQDDSIKSSTPSFAPTLTPRAQTAQPSSSSVPVVAASAKKRQRRCEEVYRCFAGADGYIDRSGWVRLAKAWYMQTGELERLRWQLERDDVAAIQMMVRECDRQVRRDRRAGSVEEECTWQVSLADFQLWMERLWQVVLNRAETAEREEERAVHKFTAAPEPHER